MSRGRRGPAGEGVETVGWGAGAGRARVPEERGRWRLSRSLGLRIGRRRAVKSSSAPRFQARWGPVRGQGGKGGGGGDPVAAGLPAPESRRDEGGALTFSTSRSSTARLAAQGAVLNAAGGGQRQEAEQAAGEAGTCHGADALGPGRGLRPSLGSGLLSPAAAWAERCLKRAAAATVTARRRGQALRPRRALICRGCAGSRLCLLMANVTGDDSERR